jgi:tRNA/tmRNA/rRNA uracil-C5-methylase (TrmA/RlmC/RlmD family)
MPCCSLDLFYQKENSRTAKALPPQVSGAAVADAQANAARNGISNAMFWQADLDQGMPAAAAGVAAFSAPDIVIIGRCHPQAAAGFQQ